MIDLNRSPYFVEWIEKNMCPSFKKRGEVINGYNFSVLGKHTGIFNYYLGQSEVKMREGNLDNSYVVTKFNYDRSEVIVFPRDTLKMKYIRVRDFKSPSDYDCSRIIESFVLLKKGGETFPCRLHFRNNNVLIVELHESVSFCVFNGQFLLFYSKRGSGAKVIGSGSCDYSYFYENGKMHKEVRQIDQEFDEDGNSITKASRLPYEMFKF